MSIEPFPLLLLVADDKLYWVDSGSLSLERCNFDGSGRDLLRGLPGTFSPSSVVVLPEAILWTDRSKNGICILDRNTEGLEPLNFDVDNIDSDFEGMSFHGQKEYSYGTHELLSGL